MTMMSLPAHTDEEHRGSLTFVPSRPWVRVWRGPRFSLRYRPNEAAPLALFEVRSLLAVHPLLVTAAIREGSLGVLAGDLCHWMSVERSAGVREVAYVVRLPWPLTPRAFFVHQEFSLRASPVGALPDLVVRCSDGADRHHSGLDPNQPWGRVVCSDYRVRPVQSPQGLHTELCRRIQVDLDAPWLPSRVGNAALVANYIQDNLRLTRLSTVQPDAPIRRAVHSDAPLYRRLRRVWSSERDVARR